MVELCAEMDSLSERRAHFGVRADGALLQPFVHVCEGSVVQPCLWPSPQVRPEIRAAAGSVTAEVADK